MPTVVELETLMTRFLGDNSDILKKLKDVESELVLVNHLLDTTSRKGQQTFNSFSYALSGFASEVTHTALSLVNLEGGLIGVSSRAVQLYADFQQLRVAFGVLAKDTIVADKVLKDLYKFAAETPFTVQDVVSASEQMLAFGASVDSLVPSMKMLGEVSAALPRTSLKDLTYLYGTLRAQGRAMTVDLRQFSNRGIPIYLELAKALKLVDQEATQVSTGIRARIDKLTEEGQINFEIVEQAFQNMTKAGGQFAGIMEKQSKELKGVFNNMREEINMSLRELGEIIAKELRLKETAQFVTNLAKEFKSLDKDTKANIVNTLALGSAIVTLTAGVVASRVAFNALSLSLGGYTASATAATIATSALYAAALVGGGVLADQFSKAYDELRGYKRGLEDVNADTEKSVKSMANRYTELINTSRTFSPDVKKQYLSDVISASETAARGYNKALADVNKEMEDLVKNNNMLEMGLFKQAESEEMKGRATGLIARLKATQEGIKRLREESEKVVGGNVGNQKEFVELAAAIQKQTRELGLNSVEKMIAKARNDGLNESEINSLKILQGQFDLRKLQTDRIEEQKKAREGLRESIDKTIESLEDEAEQLKDLDGHYKSANLSRRATELGMQKELEGMIQVVKIREDIVRWQKEENKLRQDSKQIIESLKSPLDKFNEAQLQLTKMLDADLITYNQFNKAMDQANNRFLEATNSANGFKDALEGIDAVLSGSAAARGRISAYLDSLPGRIGAAGRNWGTFTAPMPHLPPFRERAPFPHIPGMPRDIEEDRDFVPMFRNAGRDNREMIDILKQIAASTAKEAATDNIVIRPVDLER